MALTNTWPGVTAAATTTDARKNLAGLIVKDTSGVARSGIFPAHTNPLVTARADMNVDIAAFTGVAVQFGGPILIANDGVAQLPSVLVSPGSGTNYYVIYAKQNESTSPGTDGSNTKVFGAQLSTTSLAVARAAMPTGALELGTVEMPTGKTATNQAGVVITATHRFTATEGAVVLLRNSTEEAAWSPRDGAVAYRVDTEELRIRTDGAWSSMVGPSGVDAAGWTWVSVGGKRTYRKYWSAWAGVAFGPMNGSNWTQARDAAVVVPTGKAWSDFAISVDVWTGDTSNNGVQVVIEGFISNPTGSANKSLIFYNPTAQTVPNTFMSLQACVTLVEK